MRIVHQWRNLKQLKCGGRAYEDGGILGTNPGELALLCPACPHPGVNLPPNWELAPADKMCSIFILLTLMWTSRISQVLVRPLRWNRCELPPQKEEGFHRGEGSQPEWWVGIFRRGRALQGTPRKALRSETRCKLALAALVLDFLTCNFP